MNVAEALAGVKRVFLDTAPVIYAIENDPNFSERTREILDHCKAHGIELVVGPITLAELLAGSRQADMLKVMPAFLLETEEITFRTLGEDAAAHAAKLRRETSLKLPDALQVGQALAERCDLLLTNDADLAKRQTAIRTVTLGELNKMV